jgi:SAM-dependent methyltransferase
VGNNNQFNWIDRNRELVKPPILEVGSKQYDQESTVNYKELFKGYDYLGIDLQAGENVDIAVDLTQDFNLVSKKIGDRKFGTVICCSVLEHIFNIFQAAQNISNLTKSGGVLFVSVPVVWKFHGYPSDYWRFTPEAIKKLFVDFSFIENKSTISSNLPDDEQALGKHPNDFTVKWTKPNKSITQLTDKENAESLYEITQSIAVRPKYRYAMIPATINMVGVKK